MSAKESVNIRTCPTCGHVRELAQVTVNELRGISNVAVQLRPRSFNLLKANVTSLGDLLACSIRDVVGWRGCGVRTAVNIAEFLECLDLHLQDDGHAKERLRKRRRNREG